MLDLLAGEVQAKILKEYELLWTQFSEVQKEIGKLATLDRQRLRERDWAQRELDEIEAVRPLKDEEQSLESSIKTLASAEEVSQLGTELSLMLGGDNAITDLLGRSLSSAAKLATLDPRMDPVVESLSRAEAEVAETSRTVVDIVSTLEWEPSRLDRLQARAEQIKSLVRKYGPTLKDVLSYEQELIQKIDLFDNGEERLEELKSQAESLRKKLRQVAAAITKERTPGGQ